MSVGAEAISKLVDLAVEQKWLDKLISALRKQHKVLVLGSTGVGKTNFIKSLTEELPEAIHHLTRTQFVKPHGMRVLEQPFVFIDTPGQYEARRMEAIREATKGVAGIINVVSYGYHEALVGKEKAITNTGEVRPLFLEEQREIEIEDLGSWTTQLGSRAVANWLITIISKADLWWDKREKVTAYYTSGPYDDALGGAKRLDPVVMEYCSVFHKFYGKGRLSGNLDDADRSLLRTNLLSQLLAAVSR